MGERPEMTNTFCSGETLISSIAFRLFVTGNPTPLPIWTACPLERLLSVISVSSVPSGSDLLEVRVMYSSLAFDDRRTELIQILPRSGDDCNPSCIIARYSCVADVSP